MIIAFNHSSRKLLVLHEELILNRKTIEEHTQKWWSRKPNKCIICLKESPASKFTSKEHVVPEGLGNKELVLPKGIVCTRCNSKLSKSELSFQRHSMFRSLRSFYVNEGKKGDVVEGRFENGKIYMNDGQLKCEIHPIDDKPLVYEGNNRLAIRILSKKSDSLHDSISLHKIGYELAFIEDQNICEDPNYDSIRIFLIGNGQYRKFYSRFIAGAQPGYEISVKRFGNDVLFNGRILCFEFYCALIGDIENYHDGISKQGFKLQEKTRSEDIGIIVEEKLEFTYMRKEVQIYDNSHEELVETIDD